METTVTTCCLCDSDVDTEDAGFDSTDADSWVVINGKTYCPDEWMPCVRCEEPCMAESDGCVRDGDFHCPDCGAECSQCGRYEASEREPYDD